MQSLGPNLSVEREMGSLSAVLSFPRVLCAQEGLGEGV